VSNEGLDEALDRFSQFFITPLLDEGSVDKEMNAVDSEFHMSKQNDALRQHILLQTLSHDGSNLNRFGCGNLESLKVPGIRDELLKFHKKWYSANIMKLVVSSKHPIELLEKWVREKFSDIENKNIVLPDLSLPVAPYTKENLGQFIKFVPIESKSTLTVVWYLPDFHSKAYGSSPLSYFTHLLND